MGEDEREGREVVVNARLAMRGTRRSARCIIVVGGAMVMYSGVGLRNQALESLSNGLGMCGLFGVAVWVVCEVEMELRGSTFFAFNTYIV